MSSNSEERKQQPFYLSEEEHLEKKIFLDEELFLCRNIQELN